jgi:RNA polymerase sigma factor (sigma-70 family)
MYATPQEIGEELRHAKEEGLDARLVRTCLAGSEEAWSELIDRYKNLIFSIPLKYGLSREDAADIFQEVCMSLLSQMSNIKDPKALPKWLIQVTAHKCFHWKNRVSRLESAEPDEDKLESTFQTPPEMLEVLRAAEQEQLVREAIGRMPARCQKIVDLLFFEDPPRPYREVAAELGVAVGSIGLLRHRCIQQLRDALSQIGVSSPENLR